MGRPKLYADAAAKHRAYRQRLAAETVRVDRRRWAALEAQVDQLAEAVAQARRAGCPAAGQIVGVSSGTILESLTAWFTRQAASPGELLADPRKGDSAHKNVTINLFPKDKEKAHKGI